MSCLLFLVIACMACGMLFQTYRVKLKTRYTLSFAITTVLFCVYKQFPVCGYPANQDARFKPIEKDKVRDFEKIEFQNQGNKVFIKGFSLRTQNSISNLSKNHGSDLVRKSWLDNGNLVPAYRLFDNHDIDQFDKDIVDKKINENEFKNYDKRVKKYDSEKKKEEKELPKKIIKNMLDGNEENDQENANDENGYDDDVSLENDDQESEEINEHEQLMQSPRFNKSFVEKLTNPFFLKFSGKSNNFLYQNNMDKNEKEKYFFDLQKNKKLLPYFSPKEIEEKMKRFLPWWEQIEITNYPRIWYAGEMAKRKLRFNMTNPYNYGFDKFKNLEGGMYKIMPGDHLEYRYQIIKNLGSGSFGSVVLARDHALTNDDPHHMVAVKVMHNDTSTESYFKKEIDLMQMIHHKTYGSEYFSTVLRTFFFRNHLCYVMELLNSTLEESRNNQPVVDLLLLRKYTSDILKGLLLLHKENIIHGDLKPENLMFVPNCNISCSTYVKIVDFSLSCIPNSEEFECPGSRFQTRLYRAPEVIMNLDYTPTADIWSVGVILAELYFNKVPFYGESSTDQLAAIMEVMGLLPPYMVEISPNIKTYQKAVCYTCKNGFERTPYRKTLPGLLSGMPDDLYDFIKNCFELDYRRRMTPSKALKHRFLTSR